jgi:hypothetical protein
MQSPWSCRLSKSDSLPGDAFLFDHWVVEEFRRLDGFTALVVLVGIGGYTVAPLRSTFMHVIGEELDWIEFCKLLAGAGVAWDGVLLETVSAQDGGPVTDADARAALQVLEKRVVEDRLVMNEGHFFDKWGRRLKIEEALPQ